MRKTLTVAATLAIAAAAVPVASAAGGQTAQVAVLHGVPGLTVDVYAGDDQLLSDFAPGTLTDPLSLPAGEYDLAVYEAGADPESATPAIKSDDVTVPAGANITVVAHLAADGTPSLTPFVNDVSAVEPGQARLTVRHTAAAPPVDVRAGGDPVVTALANPDEQTLSVPAGTVSADVVLAGTDTVVLGPQDLDLAEGTHTLLYAWGSAEDGNLALAAQSIDGLHSSPRAVPSGEAGLAGAGVNGWWALLAAGALAGAVGASRRLVGARR